MLYAKTEKGIRSSEGLAADSDVPGLANFRRSTLGKIRHASRSCRPPRASFAGRTKSLARPRSLRACRDCDRIDRSQCRTEARSLVRQETATSTTQEECCLDFGVEKHSGDPKSAPLRMVSQQTHSCDALAQTITSPSPACSCSHA